MDDVSRLFDYWNEKYPPVHELVAQYLGVEPKKDLQPQDVLQLASKFGIVQGSNAAEWEQLEAMFSSKRLE